MEAKVTSAAGRETLPAKNELFECRVIGETLVVSFIPKMQVLSWAIWNGGFRGKASHIINHQVPSCSLAEKPETVLRRRASRLRLSGTIVGMMTAADVRRYSMAHASYKDLQAYAITTAGCGNLACVGEEGKYVEPSSRELRSGTVNVLLVPNYRLSHEAMLEAIQIATEAKVKAMYEVGLRSKANGEPATGTGTDCVAVVVGYERRYRFCGKHTKWGELIGKASLAREYPSSPACSRQMTGRMEDTRFIQHAVSGSPYATREHSVHGMVARESCALARERCQLQSRNLN